MRRFTLVLVLVLALFALPALAQDDNIQITFPPPVYSLEGTVEITGTVNPPDLQNYFFEMADYNADPTTVSWTPVTLPSRAAVTNGDAGAAQYGDCARRHLHAARCASSINPARRPL